MTRVLVVVGVLGLAGVILAIEAASCEQDVCYQDHYANVTSYTVHPNMTSHYGISVDYHRDEVGLVAPVELLSQIDSRTQYVEECLRNMYPGGQLPYPVINEGHCLHLNFDLDVHKKCMKVLIAPDSHVGCAGEQVFQCNVDSQLCIDKGLQPTDSCPCECRSTIQDDSVIVTTPDLHLYNAELIRLMTGCNNIWVTGLQECYKP